ncbi:MAG: hypothetical protein WC073_10875 [Sterolibacterium sp.]
MIGMLAIEPLLVERIRQEVIVPGLKVVTSAEMVGVKENSQPVPAVHVVYDGPVMRVEKGLVEIIERWITVVAVRNLRSTRSGEDARQDAGPILDAVFSALLGWQPVGVKPLLPSNPPRPYFNAGYAYFPLAWEARLKKIPMPCIG